MNCEEFRSYTSDRNALGERAAIEHLETCAPCRALSYSQAEVGRYLSVVRDSVPDVPTAMDAAVMSAYRREMERQVKGSRRHWKVPTRIAWTTLAAGLVIGTVLLMAHRGREVPAIPTAVKTAPMTPVPKDPEAVVKKAAASPKTTTARAKAQTSRVRPKAVAPAVATNDAADSGFQNLMYCDQLSCSGAMQVIRIQVPASAVERVPAWRPANGLVQADVVVGSDGVARAIRIVK